MIGEIGTGAGEWDKSYTGLIAGLVAGWGGSIIGGRDWYQQSVGGWGVCRK